MSALLQEYLPLVVFIGIALVIGLALLVFPAPVALADSGRTPAEATAHAIDELANAVAQGKITLTPTPSATPAPSPTATPASRWI